MISIFSLNFQNFNYAILGFSCLGFAQLLTFMSSVKFRNISTIVSLSTFSVLLSFSSPSRTLNAIIPYVLDAPLFFIYFLSVVQLSESYCSLLHFNNPFIYLFHSAIKSIHEFGVSCVFWLGVVTVFYNSKISIWFYFISSISLLKLSVFHLLDVCS